MAWPSVWASLAGVAATGVTTGGATTTSVLGVLGALVALSVFSTLGVDAGTETGAESAEEEGAFFAIVVFVYITM